MNGDCDFLLIRFPFLEYPHNIIAAFFNIKLKYSEEKILEKFNTCKDSSVLLSLIDCDRKVVVVKWELIFVTNDFNSIASIIILRYCIDTRAICIHTISEIKAKIYFSWYPHSDLSSLNYWASKQLSVTRSKLINSRIQ